MRTAALVLLGVALGGLGMFLGLWIWLVWYMSHGKKPAADIIVNLPDKDIE